jgi:hypothetical protein
MALPRLILPSVLVLVSLFDLESAIDKSANAEQWTGDVSQQGADGTTYFEN